MLKKPKYAETVIVLVKNKNHFRWFVADKEIWFLDLKKLNSSYLEKGYNIPDPDDFSDRFNIAVVSEETAEDFLLQLSDFEARTEELREMLEQRTYSHISDMLPSLYVDFDNKELTSYYPEPASYEFYVPDGWLGKYGQFIEVIPEVYRYWIIQGTNQFL
ncbi:hypothetical protein F4V43_13545 [Paenibacillus spiritus]|uniref:Group-specific protein n=1 Tax=Paenibacillus spiritus TaxID=2496557 RepID=A0A5J5G526_9BACL|nr:hypothetical protein [Paenibacillus spiritus]KAA9002080.1 hypothetical protein F4V43_13545 [Paenibacillus spiritus]